MKMDWATWRNSEEILGEIEELEEEFEEDSAELDLEDFEEEYETDRFMNFLERKFEVSY